MNITDVSETSIGTQITVKLDGFRRFEKPTSYKESDPSWPRMMSMGQQVCRLLGETPEGRLCCVDKRWVDGYINYQFSWRSEDVRSDSEEMG